MDDPTRRLGDSRKRNAPPLFLTAADSQPALYFARASVCDHGSSQVSLFGSEGPTPAFLFAAGALLLAEAKGVRFGKAPSNLGASQGKPEKAEARNRSSDAQIRQIAAQAVKGCMRCARESKATRLL